MTAPQNPAALELESAINKAHAAANRAILAELGSGASAREAAKRLAEGFGFTVTDPDAGTLELAAEELGIELEPKQTIRTEDRVELEIGARAYNYYDMKPGTIGRINSIVTDPDPWFDFDHDDGSRSLLNGARICSMEYARRRGFPNADGN